MQEKIDAHRKLWSIRLPIPDETFAAPSHRIAALMKEASDKANHAWLTDKQKKGELCYFSYDECIALIEEIEDPEEHAELMEEFDPEEWGITEAQMNEPDVDPRQLALPLEAQELREVQS